MNDGEMVLPPEVTMKSRARSMRPQRAVTPFADIAGTQEAVDALIAPVASALFNSIQTGARS